MMLVSSSARALATARPSQQRANPLSPPLKATTAPQRRLVSVKYRDATKAETNAADAPSWRRHFMESDPPDESTGPTAIIQRAKEVMRDSPVKLADLALPSIGALGSVALSDHHDWPAVGVGIAAGAVARLLQQATLEQKVPFTLRRHTLLLPVFAELLLGQFSYAQVLQQPQYRGKVLPPDHPDSKLVKKIAERIIGAVEEGHGGGFQKHIEKFEWEVVVIDEPGTVNAFVLPGGKICTFTGLINLFNRNEDMLATVIGHECAHAVARHTSEKLTLGIFVTLAVQLLLYSVQRSMSGGGGDPRQQQQEDMYRRQQQGQYGGGYGGDPRADPRFRQDPSMDPRYGYDPRMDPRYRQQDPRYGQSPYGPYARDPYTTARRSGRNIYYVLPDAFSGESAAPRFPPGYRGGPPGAYGGRGGGGRGSGGGFGGGGSPVTGLINIATNLLLQLPFSRRAEAEADLIGLKLMTIAGYRSDMAPKTFAKMEEYQARMMGKAAANASYIQDHPRSANRVKLLEGELELMKQYREGREIVLTKVPYWML